MNEFDVAKVTEDIINFIKKHFKDNGLDGIIMGISGGKDSMIASALFTKALGSENVIGITMPCHSITSDTNDAKRVADFLGFKLYTLDLTNIYDTFLNALIKELEINDEDILKEANINLKPRLRMSSLYYFTQSLSIKNNKKYIVAGTGNKSEITIGYFTKWGDGASDINVLADLTVNEVITIGDYLGIPKDLVHKTPSDGLSGSSDEEKLGFTYNEVEAFLNGKNVNPKIINMYQNTNHKRKPITIFNKNNIDDAIKEMIKILKHQNKTISTMESCTSGMLASTITNIDDSSTILKFSAITYSNEYKIKMGVDKDIIDKYSVYSKEVSIEMAKKITLYANSNYGVGITGKLGIEDKNNPYGDDNKVYITLYNKDKDIYNSFDMIVFEDNRGLGKKKVTEMVIIKLLEFIK